MDVDKHGTNGLGSPSVEAHLAGIELFLVDQDGTVFLGDHLLPGAARFFEVIAAQGRRHLFLSNNSSQSASYYVDKLTRLGLPAAPENILTSGQATIAYLQGELPGARIFLLGTPPLEREFVEGGFELVDGARALADGADAVVLGFDKTLTYEKLEVASRLLLAGVPYFATHGDLVCPTPDGPIPDAGAMIALMEKATGRTPVIVGKPEPRLVDMARQRFSVPRSATAMIGDRLYTDMEMGRRAGITSILVLSGETREPPGEDPRVTMVFKDLGELADALEAVGPFHREQP